MDDSLVLREFLGANKGQFCDGCLAARLGMAREDVKVLVYVGAREFVRAPGYCTACRQLDAVNAIRLAA